MFLVAAVFACSGVALVLSPAVASAAPAKKPCVQQFYRNGSRGDCVGYIQNMLNLSAKARLETDRKFGLKTKAVVIAWQAEKKIMIDGVVGPQTWATLCAVNDASSEAYKIHKVLAGCSQQFTCVQRTFSTDTNPRDICVTHIQNMMNLANEAKLDTDGQIGVKTKAAVKAWQTKQKQTNKKLSVDGSVGTQTWKTLCDYKMPDISAQAIYDTNRKAVGCN